MRIWLDDVRPMPKGWDLHVKTVEEAQEILETFEVKAISFDHDLGSEKTGYDLAKWIESAAYMAGLPPLEWDVHSSNPVGAKNIESAMKMAERYWNATRATFMRKPYWNKVVDWQGAVEPAEEWFWRLDSELNTVLSPAGIVLLMIDHPDAPEEKDMISYIEHKLQQKQNIENRNNKQRKYR